MIKQILFFLLFIFIISLHPLQKTLTLIAFVLFLIIQMANTSSHWVCYLLALVYFGGVLILFTYISSVIPNFAPNRVRLILPLLVRLILPLLDSENLSAPIEGFNTTELPLSFISSLPSFFIIYFILGIVLLLLILRVSILSDFKSPLRNI